MDDKAWTMNCLIVGVQIAELLRLGRVAQALHRLRYLTAELTLEDIDYILLRTRNMGEEIAMGKEIA